MYGDERGIRTPEVQSTTGLAILRHTGLGYLVSENCVKLLNQIFTNAVEIYNSFLDDPVYDGNWICIE